MMLALQEHFLSLEYSPVPSLLVIDQPSQVYFPKRVTIRAPDDIDDDPQFRDEDVEAVRKIFQAIAKVVQSAEGQLQVVILDHAPPDIWEDIPHIGAFEEWRGGLKLVPETWL